MLRWMPRLVVLSAVWLASPSFARTIHVHVDTSPWRYYQGYLLFTYVTSIPESVRLDEENRVSIRNLRSDGQMGLDDSHGGVSGGKHDVLATQPYTWTIDPDDVPDGDKGRYRYNELPVNFTKRYWSDPDALWLGTFIDFDLELPNSVYIPDAVATDAFAMSFLNQKGDVAFPTADPLGGDALVACSPKRGTRSWQVEAYRPAVYQHGAAGRIDSIDVRLPAPPTSAGGPVQQIHLPPSIKRVDREAGVVWIEYTIPVQTSGVRIRVLDADGVECYRRDIGDVKPGTYGNEWPERGGTPPAPGKYRVILEAGGQTVEKPVEL